MDIKNTIRDGGSNALYAAYTVDTVDMVYNGRQIFGTHPIDSYDYWSTCSAKNTIRDGGSTAL